MDNGETWQDLAWSLVRAGKITHADLGLVVGCLMQVPRGEIELWHVLHPVDEHTLVPGAYYARANDRPVTSDDFYLELPTEIFDFWARAGYLREAEGWGGDDGEYHMRYQLSATFITELEQPATTGE
jgi:hypothetical protein